MGERGGRGEKGVGVGRGEKGRGVELRMGGWKSEGGRRGA